jgi:hypothetical protein
MKMKMQIFYAATVTVIAIFAPTLALAEGWVVKSFFPKTTKADCINKAADAFKGIAGTIARGNNTVYGYDLRKKDNYDAMILCQRPAGAKATDVSDIAVVLVMYDLAATKKSTRIRQELKDQIVERYKISVKNN